MTREYTDRISSLMCNVSHLYTFFVLSVNAIDVKDREDRVLAEGVSPLNNSLNWLQVLIL